MLGNFSFGDYFKEQAIQWAWELSTGVFGLSPKNLVVSVFREDDEAEAIWRDVVGVNPKRIIRMDEADNFWASGPTGPCGPCSEIYYDRGPSVPGTGDFIADVESGSDRFVEVYCRCPLEVCEQRDPKGLYKKARQGLISDFTGISSPYEKPEHPEVVLKTGEESLEASVEKVLEYLRGKGFIGG